LNEKFLLWAVAAGIAWLGVTASVHAQWLSPGSLSEAHAKLDDDQHCSSCHASGSRVAESGCVQCHSDIGAQRTRRVGLHGTLLRDQPCAQCHVEHLGRKTSLIRWPGRAKEQFDHAQTGWALREAHAKAECSSCHTRKNERGAPTFLGLEPRCNSCHEDPHRARFGTQCLTCHNQTSFKQLRLDGFDHALARFPLEGHHAQVECAQCHKQPPQYKGLAFNDCNGCHQDPHQGRLKSACKSCHVAEGWQEIAMPRSRHPGLDLGGGHQKVACSECHGENLDAVPSAGRRCVDCHAPVHEAPFGTDCAKCHTGIRWVGLPDALGHRLHSLTEFPLRGAHRTVECEGCHALTVPLSARFREIKHQVCAECHADVHRGTLKEHGDCELCHHEVGFAPSLVSTPVHAKFGFPLEGAHAATACNACHAHDSQLRTHWSVADKRCESCHQNPHGDQFAAEIASKGCAGCHTARSWNVVSFEHPFWPLTGAHSAAACQGCHRRAAPNADPSRLPLEIRSAQYKGAPRTCEGCHDDPHGAQFRLLEPARTCDSCHSTEAFSLASFDHAERAGYPLSGKHRELACGTCHPTVQLRNGEDVIKYRLGYSACADCHADPHSEPGANR